jgi:cupin 2 domain-containing protein
MMTGNLLTELLDASDGECFETLLVRDGVRIERIVSKGQATPEGEWYDQPWHEWVLLVVGEAQVQLEKEHTLQRLLPGQWLLLPAHCRHRVVWTRPGQETVWLALHWPEQKTDTEGADDGADHG